MNTLTSRLRPQRSGWRLRLAAPALPAWAADATDERVQASNIRHRRRDRARGRRAAAGPVGAVIGAAAGALLGDRYHRQTQTSARSATASATAKPSARTWHRVSHSSTTRSRGRAPQPGSSSRRCGDRRDRHGRELPHRRRFVRCRGDAAPEARGPGGDHAGANVRVAGYADPRGSAAYNDLSQRRAQAVAAVLAARGCRASAWSSRRRAGARRQRRGRSRCLRARAPGDGAAGGAGLRPARPP